ncbi:MAG: transaldolase [Prolixibacteraceae bacterium]|nr:transaldolase [Prolixibacteraceae bacterium]
MNLLEQLKSKSKIVADSGDFESIRTFKPSDATTNPSLILASASDVKNAPLISGAVSYAKQQSTQPAKQLSLALDKLIVDFGIEILKIVPGRVSTETDARLSFDTKGIVKKSHELISLYNEHKIDRNRVLIKIASTWEGIKAAEQLSKEGIHCNLTLLFSMPQAIACAEADVQLISPFVGRILDWHLKNSKQKSYASAMEPGVLLVTDIFNYYKKFGHKTEIMAASFRNIGEITALSGCDLMTISPKLLAELEGNKGKLEQKLFAEKAKDLAIEKIEMDEKKFRWYLNEDAMATEKLAEGIRKFTMDTLKLEQLIIKQL